MDAQPISFSFDGTIVPGEQVGRTIGFPTANFAIAPSPTDLPQGVYFGWCEVDESSNSHPCLAYFGPRHIFGEVHLNFEVYVYNFSGDLYGKRVFAHLTHFVREPVKITTLPELQELLERDKQTGLELLRHHERINS